MKKTHFLFVLFTLITTPALAESVQDVSMLPGARILERPALPTKYASMSLEQLVRQKPDKMTLAERQAWTARMLALESEGKAARLRIK